jgi:hypothetical protein
MKLRSMNILLDNIKSTGLTATLVVQYKYEIVWERKLLGYCRKSSISASSLVFIYV